MKEIAQLWMNGLLRQMENSKSVSMMMGINIIRLKLFLIYCFRKPYCQGGLYFSEDLQISLTAGFASDRVPIMADII